MLGINGTIFCECTWINAVITEYCTKTAENQQLPYNGELDLFKPLNNILLGTAHLNELNAKYPNNRILIASAYNAGASRVEKWLARANGKLAMDEFIASIPFFETRGMFKTY